MEEQKGFIEIVVIFLLLLSLWLIWPTSFHSEPKTLNKSLSSIASCTGGIFGSPASIGSNTVFLGPVAVPEGDEELEFPNPTEKQRYTLIRANVPVYSKYLLEQAHMRDIRNERRFQNVSYDLPLGKSYRVYYPTGKADISHYEEIGGKIGKTNDNKYYLLTGQRGVKNGNLVFLAQLDADGKEIATADTDVRGDQLIFWLTDIYQLEGLAPPPDWVFKCPSFLGIKKSGFTRDSGSQTAIIGRPNQDLICPSDRNKSVDRGQLQLEYCGPGAANVIVSKGGWTAECKPAIYLYPEKQQYINVRVQTKGYLTYTDPKYPLLGWTTLANPDGRLLVDGKKYEYLYYESKVPDSEIRKPEKGYVVPNSDLSNLYSVLLPKLGLDWDQTNDFKQYWEKTLPDAPYYFVGVMNQEDIDAIEPLIITPKPVTVIRVRLYFEALDKPIDAKEPSLQTPKREGFTVVEWGGMVKTDKDHPFTCSQ